MKSSLRLRKLAIAWLFHGERVKNSLSHSFASSEDEGNQTETRSAKIAAHDVTEKKNSIKIS